MTARDVLVRLAGGGLIAAGCGTSLWLRSLMPDAPQDPTLLELGLVLASFLLTLGGAIIALNGQALFGQKRQGRASSGHDTVRAYRADESWSFGDDRQILANLLARRSGKGIK